MGTSDQSVAQQKLIYFLKVLHIQPSRRKGGKLIHNFFVHKSQSFGAILMSAHIKSVTRFGEISPRLQNFIVFGHFKGFWYLAKQIEPTLANFYAAEQFFTDTNDQRLKIISASGHTAW